MKPVWPILICLSLTVFLIPQKSGGQTISGVINSYYEPTAIIYYGTHNSQSYSGITLQSIAGLASGDRVLIIQMKGASITSTDNSSFGNITSIGNAGKYEFSSICGFLNNTIVLSNHLLHTYDVSSVQVVRVPVYTNVTVTGTLRAGEWDPATETGGVIALEATGTVTLNAAISADSAGFKGGGLFVNTTDRCGEETAYYYSLAQSSGSNLGGSPKGEGIAYYISSREYGRGKQSNGGGGANVDNTGGGGGSNYGTGGNGGQKSNSFWCSANTVGLGGVALNSYGYPASVTATSTANKIFLGGGGGSGEMNNIYDVATGIGEGTPGGDGGGIVFIKAATLTGNGYTISANGAQGVNPVLPVKTEAAGDGGGGGGAGGVVILNVSNFSGNLSVQASGANGSNAGFQNACPGPGGGGGGGVIWSSGSLPGTVTTNVTGGASGIIKNAPSHNPPCEGSANGAVAGSNGLIQSGYVAPQGNISINCSILPLDLLKQFTGKRNNQLIQLNWSLINAEQVKKVVLEKKTGNGAFISVTEQQLPVENGFYVDEINAAPVTYRLLLFASDGAVQYSKHLFFDAAKNASFNLYPNPVSDKVTVQLPVNTKGKTIIAITDVNGKQLLQQEILIQPSQTILELSLKQLPVGIYQIRLVNNGQQFIAKLIRQ
ncbi:T9SS type A sorting domain-containing protein [Lacibacter luteus]|uniref:T9SS type A sorting domain-containing protein n=1 Tax=Lacibacter luteus TaxID=2508719 RepID=A0A4Q1CFG3_9BACT|nr:T9SS type A sorting domain-containing protein [Lacibacter luteus]RXK58377.1 T9SS type A sorting domain-containing protein [Lacibacter luteus]